MPTASIAPISTTSANRAIAFIGRSLILGSFSLLAVYGLYLRARLTESEDGATGGLIASITAVALAAVLLAVGLVKRPRLDSSLIIWATLFFVCSVGFPALSIVFLQVDPGIAGRLISEVIVCAAMFLCGYLILRLELASLTSIAMIVALSGIICGYFTLSDFLEVNTYIRRLEGFGAVNYVANVYAGCALCCLYLVAKALIRRNLAFAATAAAGAIFAALLVVLLGSRQAAAALVLTCGWFAFGALGPRVGGGMLVITLPVAVLSMLVLSQSVDTSILLQRFEPTAISNAVTVRAMVFSGALVGLEPTDLLIGRPDLYGALNVESTNPHNIIISALRHFGVFTALSLTFSLIHLFFKGCTLGSRSIDANALAFALLMFAVTIFYVMASGHITRSFHFFLFWGIAVAVIQTQSEVARKLDTRRQGSARPQFHRPRPL